VSGVLSLSAIGLDSQCLSYLIDALEGVPPPADDHAEQKVALVRLYLYSPRTLWVTPAVEREFSRIRDEVSAPRTSVGPAFSSAGGR
jgi:hypothetical protein